MLKQYSVFMTTPKKLSGEQNFEVQQQLASFFRERREAAGLSIDAVAKELCPDSPELLADYESGKSQIALDDIFALTNILNIPPEDVLALIFDLYADSESY